MELGGFGHFQLLAYLIIFGSWCSVNFTFSALGYFIQEPVYKCEFHQNFTEEESRGICTAENIWAGDGRIASWEVDYEAEKTLHNWQQRLDLMCV